tara:strand:+ start:519 stop:914 length:396 start_codon:yes stop_codon:yes gene_type:complete
MADTKVSDLNPITVPGNNDILYIVDTTSGGSKKITFQNLLSGVNLTVTELDSTVTEFTTLVTQLSSDVENANLNIPGITDDIYNLSAQQAELSGMVVELEGLPTYGLSNSFVLASSTFTFLSGILLSVTPT